MSRENSPAKRTRLLSVDLWWRLYYWCSGRSPPIESCQPNSRSFNALSLGGGGDRITVLHRTFSEQVCRRARGLPKGRYCPSITRIDARIVTLAKRITDSEIHGPNLQNVYIDPYRKDPLEAISPLFGKTGCLYYFWELESSESQKGIDLPQRESVLSYKYVRGLHASWMCFSIPHLYCRNECAGQSIPLLSTPTWASLIHCKDSKELWRHYPHLIISSFDRVQTKIIS